jgi:hypothetical protein
MDEQSLARQLAEAKGRHEIKKFLEKIDRICEVVIGFTDCSMKQKKKF